MLDEEYRGFEDVLARLRKLPAAAGPANRIYELFRNLATSGAPKSIIGQLVRYTHSEVLSAEVARRCGEAPLIQRPTLAI
jgi:hypothetical protein